MLIFDLPRCSKIIGLLAAADAGTMLWHSNGSLAGRLVTFSCNACRSLLISHSAITNNSICMLKIAGHSIATTIACGMNALLEVSPLTICSGDAVAEAVIDSDACLRCMRGRVCC